MGPSPIKKVLAFAIGGALLIGLLIVASRFFSHQFRRSHQFDSEIAAAAARYKIDPALVKAVIWRESNFDPKAKGTSGEIGLMQIREDAAFEWADAERMDNFEHTQLWDHNRNIHA